MEQYLETDAGAKWTQSLWPKLKAATNKTEGLTGFCVPPCLAVISPCLALRIQDNQADPVSALAEFTEQQEQTSQEAIWGLCDKCEKGNEQRMPSECKGGMSNPGRGLGVSLRRDRGAEAVVSKERRAQQGSLGSLWLRKSLGHGER